MSGNFWDIVGESFNDGIGELVDAGIDRAAEEISPTPAGSTSQNPRTTPITQEVGRNADGTPVYAPVNGASSISMISNKKLLLIGGVSLLGVALFLKMKK